MVCIDTMDIEDTESLYIVRLTTGVEMMVALNSSVLRLVYILYKKIKTNAFIGGSSVYPRTF